MNKTQRLYPHRMYTREEAQAAFDRDAARVMSARQDKRDAELRRERLCHDAADGRRSAIGPRENN
jgi:hypothetical protein